jgi:hypothetical protein
MTTSERTGLRRGMTHYGDPDFALYLRRSFARSMGYGEAMASALDQESPTCPRQIPGDRHVVAAPLAGGDPVLRLPVDPPDHLHDQCHRDLEHQVAPGGQDARSLPE